VRIPTTIYEGHITPRGRLALLPGKADRPPPSTSRTLIANYIFSLGNLWRETCTNEAVAIASGFTQQARHSQVVLFRRISAYVAESHVIDLKKMLDSRDLREDLHLQPGDFIFVPQSRISKIRKYVPTNSMSWYMNPLQF